MWHPAEMLLSNQLETRLCERQRVLLERRNITFFFLVKSKPVSHVASGNPNPIVHIDHHTDPPGGKQTENLTGVFQFFSDGMSISNCVCAEDEMERVLELQMLLAKPPRSKNDTRCSKFIPQILAFVSHSV
jgi:hypothetical protein